MSANPLDIRLRGLDDLILESVKRIESLESTRALHASTIDRLRDRIDKLSEAFRARTDELAGLLESAINLGQHQAAQQTDSNLRLGVSMDALQESLIRLQHDTANRIAGLSIDVRSHTNSIAAISVYSEKVDQEMQSRIGALETESATSPYTHGMIIDVQNRVTNLELKNNKSISEFIRYVHADDLRAVIREVVKELPVNPYRTR